MTEDQSDLEIKLSEAADLFAVLGHIDRSIREARDLGANTRVLDILNNFAVNVKAHAYDKYNAAREAEVVSRRKKGLLK